MFWKQVEAGPHDTVIVPCGPEEATFIKTNGIRWMVVVSGGESVDCDDEVEARRIAASYHGVIFAVVVVP